MGIVGNCYVAFFVDWNMFVNFTEHIDQHGKCKFVLASESGKFNEEGTGGHFPASYHSWYGRGTAAYFIFRVFQNLLAEWASVPRFPFLGYNHFFHRHRERGTKTVALCTLCIFLTGIPRLIRIQVL